MTAWRTIRGLSAADRRLLAEAALVLLVVRVGLYLLPFTTLRTRLQRRALSNYQPVDRVAWAVKAVSRRCPGTMCLAEALVVNSMLRCHGHTPTLKIGMRHGELPERAGNVDAHAWVECDGVVVIGAVVHLGEYAVLS